MSKEKAKLDADSIKIAMDALAKTFEDGTVFVIIGLTPYEEGKLQNWLYVSNGRRSEMIGGLEQILEKWKRRN